MTVEQCIKFNELFKESNMLKEKLKKTDYIGSKYIDAIIKGDANKAEVIAQLYSKEIKEREEWRNRINEIEAELAMLKK